MTQARSAVMSYLKSAMLGVFEKRPPPMEAEDVHLMAASLSLGKCSSCVVALTNILKRCRMK